MNRIGTFPATRQYEKCGLAAIPTMVRLVPIVRVARRSDSSDEMRWRNRPNTLA